MVHMPLSPSNQLLVISTVKGNLQWDGADMYKLAQKLNLANNQEDLDWLQANIKKTHQGFYLNMSGRDEGDRLIYIILQV